MPERHDLDPYNYAALSEDAPVLSRLPSFDETPRMLRITSVSFGRTVNLGNYESARIDATADVPDGDDPDGVWSRLVAWVNRRVDIDPESGDRRSEAMIARGLIALALLLFSLFVPLAADAAPSRPTRPLPMTAPTGLGTLEDDSAITTLLGPAGGIIVSSNGYRVDQTIEPGYSALPAFTFIYTDMLIETDSSLKYGVRAGLWEYSSNQGNQVTWFAYSDQPIVAGDCIEGSEYFQGKGCIGASGQYSTTLGSLEHVSMFPGRFSDGSGAMDVNIGPVGGVQTLVATLPVSPQSVGNQIFNVSIQQGEQYPIIDPKIDFNTVSSHPQYIGFDTGWVEWDASGTEGDNVLDVIASNGSSICPTPYGAFRAPQDNRVWAFGTLTVPPAVCAYPQVF